MIDRFVGGYRWLSNFWPVEIQLDEMKYRSVEAAYVASKTLDIEIRKYVQSLKSSGKAKSFGKTIELREDWDQVKVDYMEYFLRQKFRFGTELATKLQATGSRYIIEGNDHGDVFWGVCNGEGENKLGHLLMKIRSMNRSIAEDVSGRVL